MRCVGILIHWKSADHALCFLCRQPFAGAIEVYADVRLCVNGQLTAIHRPRNLERDVLADQFKLLI